MSRLVNLSEAASLGLHAMGLIAKGEGRRRTAMKLAEELHASGHHVAKVMQRLAKAGLVASMRGPQGGFLLSRSTEKISLLEIYEAIEGPVDTTGCLFASPPCVRTGCMLGEKIQSIRKQFQDYLRQTTLAELASSFPMGDQNCGGRVGCANNIEPMTD